MTQPSTQRRESVSMDWRSPLSAKKNQSFCNMLHRLESCYGMFSVALDEALGMRRIGRIDKAYQVLTLGPALCDKFTLALQSVLRAMSLHARHFGTAPNMSALDPDNFQDSKCQRAARFNSILSRVLLTRRSQFLQKISAVSELVEDLGMSFENGVRELSEEVDVNAQQQWKTLDATHYDLNTCLRETVVLCKCFLLALPESQLAEFHATLVEQTLPAKLRVTPVLGHLAHRRMAAIKGQ